MPVIEMKARHVRFARVCPGRGAVYFSRIKVTGPSLTSATCMSA